MATLFNTKISNTYPSLIKSLDNAAVGATLKELSDGSGNALGIKVNTAGDFLVPATLSFGSLKDIGENITITKFVDAADGITNNNNDTSIPTSKAVKDFVEAHVTAQDLDFTDGTNSGAVDLDSQSLAIIGTANEIETAASGQQLQIGIVTNPTLSGDVAIPGNIDFADNARARFGGSNDLQIYHNGTNSYVRDTGTGRLWIDSNGEGVSIISDGASATPMAHFLKGGAVELYFNNSKKVETLTGGAKVTGDLEVTGSITGSGGSFLPLAGGTMTGDIIYNDDVKAKFGTSGDLEIYHDASNSYIKDAGTGILYIQADNQLRLDCASTGEKFARFYKDGQVELFYDNQIKLTTSGTGITVTGSVTGNLIGDVTGNVTGNITGTINASSVLADGVTATTQATSDDSTKVATTAFVKSLDNASDLDFSGDSGTGDVTLNSQTFSVIGTANEVETSASNQQLQIGLPSSINVNSASATILQNARDISLTGQATATISGFDGSSNVSGAVTLDNNSVTGKVLTGLASPTASNILASDSILQAFGKAQSQINTLAGGLRFMGTWNANTNTPTLASGGGEADSGTTTGTTANKLIDSSQNFTSTVTNGDKVINQANGSSALVTNVDSNTQLTLDADIMVSGQEYTIDNSPFITQGHYFVVSVGGTSSLNGLSNWAVGDWVIAGAGNVWEKLDHTQVDGTGTAGNIAKFSSTNVIADSIMAESGAVVTVTGSLNTTQNVNSADDITIGSSGAGGNKILNILTGGGESSIKLMEAGTVYGVSQVYDGGNNQFYIKRHSNSASGSTVMTINRDNDNVSFAGNITAVGELLVGSGEYISWGSSGSAAIEGSTVANRLRFYTNSALALTLESDQDAKFEKRVGIGITPAEVLDLKAASGDTRIRLDAASGSDTEIKFFNDATAQFTIGHDDGTDKFVIGGANVDAPLVTFDKSGNIVASGILTTNGGAMSINNGGSIAGYFYGSGSSYTQGALVISSGTDNSPEARGQGVFMFNEGKDSTFYMGTRYNNADEWQVGRVAGASLDTAAATTSNAFFKINNAGKATFNDDLTIVGTEYINNIQARTSAGLKVGNDDFSGFVQVADNGQVNFDSGNSEIHLLGGGTTFGKFFKSGDNFYINNPIQDKDIIFSGDDGGSSVTALTLDMSDSGFAIFNYGVKAPFFTSDGGRGFKQDGVAFVSTYSNGSDADAANDLGTSTNRWRDLYIHGDIEATDSLTIDVTGDLSLDASGNDIRFKVNGVEYGKFKDDSDDFAIFSSIENKDILFKGNDGGTTITALQLDMSNAGSATFNDDVDLGGKLTQSGTSGTNTFNTDVEVSGGNITATSSGNTFISSVSTGNWAGMKIQADDAASAYMFFYDTSGERARLQVTGSNDFRILTGGGSVTGLVQDNLGRIGINNSAPNVRFEIGQNDSEVEVLGVRYSTVPAYISSSFDGTYALSTFSTNQYNTSDGSAGWGSMANASYGTASVQIATDTTGGELRFFTAPGANQDPTERIRVNKDGQVKINSGISSSSKDVLKLTQNTTGAIKDAAAFGLAIQNGGEATNEADLIIKTAAGGSLTERVRVTGSGSLLVNTTSNQGVGGVSIDPASAATTTIVNNTSASGAELQTFRYNSTQVGSIALDGTTGTNFNTSSDYRLKEDLQDFNGLDKVSKIKMYNFKWKSDESRAYGVMAHELKEVLPQAVSGEKDAEEMQQVDYSKIVPLLVKSIQELKTEVDSLKKQCNCK